MPNQSGKDGSHMFWLKANITAGLFPSECTVALKTADGEMQVFVARQQVNAEMTAVKVYMLDGDDTYALVQVPSQGGGSVAKIAKAGVLSAA